MGLGRLSVGSWESGPGMWRRKMGETWWCRWERFSFAPYVHMCRSGGDIDAFKINDSRILSPGLVKREDNIPFPNPAYFEQGLVEIWMKDIPAPLLKMLFSGSWGSMWHHCGSVFTVKSLGVTWECAVTSAFFNTRNKKKINLDSFSQHISRDHNTSVVLTWSQKHAKVQRNVSSRKHMTWSEYYEG